jgi:hypothetical protein
MSSRSTTDTADKEGDKEPSQSAHRTHSLLEDNALFRLFARLSDDQYKPEKYYMRGPGPKAKAKEQK